MVSSTVRKRLWLAVGAAAAVTAASAFGGSGSGTITTFAGTGSWTKGGGFSGDGGPAARAQLNGPVAVAVDGKGNVYISDYLNKRVRKVSPGGTITTFAGGGKPGSSGNGVPAKSVEMYPHRAAVDARGNVYIVEEFGLVRKVTRAGTITTIAGTRDICASKPCPGDGDPATSVELLGPQGVAVDAQGNVYITTRFDFRVHKVSRGGTITTIAGTGKLGFSGDGGPATSARLNSPHGVAVDRKGNVYIADTVNNRVRKVSRGGKITTFAGTGKYGTSGDGGPATKAQLESPMDVAVDRKGNVYIGGGCCRVRKVSPGGTITTIAGSRTAGLSGDGGPATRAQMNGPWAVAVDAQGNVYIADTANHRVRKLWK